MMRRSPTWPIHLALMTVCFVMLVPFYWVLRARPERVERLGHS